MLILELTGNFNTAKSMILKKSEKLRVRVFELKYEVSLKLAQLCQPSVLSSQIRINFPQKKLRPQNKKKSPLLK